MIGTSGVLQQEYSENYAITDRLFREREKEEVQSVTKLELTVIDSESGKPISKAMISIDTQGRTAICDDQGNAVLQDVLSGRFVLDVIVPGYIANSVLIRVSAQEQEKIIIRMIRNS
ncbi:peptidase associated/transthyretin-like domain-containing protein [Daejeonella lutea]|uniref:Carboxypeptidase regulatory-like domain-containing protein n=1 Tax=Daejeonella lutea TaxID=572036 RepID=A0A1T5DNN3_9SPHI|nr:hypothetical protein [Daejeonella lutea]SKB73221.1 hypothetical protein SAMN05661099_2468 [Daejeonella lutea]